MTTQKLQHIAPTLANLQNKETGFSLPKNYFANVENSIIALLREKEFIIENDIPKDYFEIFEDQVFKRLASEKKNRIISLKKYWLPVAVAASLLLFISIYNPFFNGYDNLSIAEIEDWINEDNLDLNAYEIADLYSLEIENITISDKLKEEEIEAYLLEEINEPEFYN